VRRLRLGQGEAGGQAKQSEHHAHFKSSITQKERGQFSADTNNLAARSAWQRMLFEYAFAEMYPWSGPDAFPPRDSRRQKV
jgi:hypothetical protein